MTEFRRLVPLQGAIAVLLQVVQTGCSLVVLRWVTPRENGIWQAMLVLESYLLIVRFGVVNSMVRQYSFLLGKAERGRAEQIVQAAQSYTLAAGMLMILGAGIAILLVPDESSWQLAAAALVVYAPASLYRNFLEATFRGGQDFAKLARAQSWQILGNIGTLPLVAWLGFPGYLGRAVLLAAAGALALHFLRPVRMKPKWNRSIIWLLVGTGVPLFISNYGTAVAGTFGRLLLLKEGGEVQIGLFSPVAALMALGGILPSVVATYVLPRLNFDLGRTGNAGAVARGSWHVGVACAVVLVPVVVIGWVTLPYLLGVFLPAYAEAMEAMRWALLLCITSCLRIGTLPFSVLQAWTPMFVYIGALLVTNFVLPWFALAWMKRPAVEAVTIGLLVASMVQIVIGIGSVRWAVGRASETDTA